MPLSKERMRVRKRKDRVPVQRMIEIVIEKNLDAFRELERIDRASHVKPKPNALPSTRRPLKDKGSTILPVKPNLDTSGDIIPEYW